MWFKNLRLFRLTEDFTLSAEQLDTALAGHAFSPCGKLDLQRMGWVPPLGPEASAYVHAANGCLLVCAKRQEKVLPAAVVNEELEEQARAIEHAEGRPVGRKERRDLKDEVIFSLLPRAFAKSSLEYAYIVPRERLVVVDAASARRAEDLLSQLRESLGSLPAVPLAPHKAPPQVMTQWLSEGQAPGEFALGEECQLQGARDARVVGFKNQDLLAEPVRGQLDELQVARLALSWRDAIHCVVDEQFAIKRLKFDDALLERAGETNPQSRAEAMDADFAVMTTELSAFLRELLHAFGGAAQDEAA